MNEKILLINIHSSKNVGDEALLFVTLKQLYEKFPSSNILLCMDDPESHTGHETAIQSIFSWVFTFRNNKKGGWNYPRLLMLLPATIIPLISLKVIKRKIWLFSPQSIRATIDGYLNSDLVVSKPGGFLYSSGRGISLLVAVYSILYAHWAGKPVYILPQSIGPFKKHWEFRLISHLLERVRIVMIRDVVSYKLLKDMHLQNRNIYIMPDLAFGLPDADSSTCEHWFMENGILLDKKHPVMGMTVINWGAQNQAFKQQADYENACARAIEYFIEEIHGKVIIFPQVYGPLVSQDDRIPAHRIEKQLSHYAEFIRVVDDPIPPELLKSIYGRMDLFIGTRMHSNIFALSNGVPVIAIGYLHKTSGIAEMVGIGNWVIDINDAQNDKIVEKLSALWNTRVEWHEKIMQKVPDLEKQASSASDYIAKDYYNNLKRIKSA